MEEIEAKSTVSRTLPAIYRKHALQTGVYVGLVTLGLNLLNYLIDDSLEQRSIGFLDILSALFPLGTCIYLARKYVQNEPSFPYSAAYVYTLVALIVNAIFSACWSVLLIHIIEPGLAEQLIDIQIERYTSPALSQQELEAAKKTMQLFLNPFLLLIFGSIFGSVWAAIISLPVALGIRKIDVHQT